MKIFKHWSAAIFAFIFMCALWSCVNRYNTNPVTRTSAYPRFIEKAKKDKRSFFMHSGVDIYTITSVEIDKAKKNMTVHLDKVDSLSKRNVNNPEVLRKQSGQPSLSKIHVYMRDSTSYTLDEPHTIPLNKVARIEEAD